ncbi:hypothetical protein Tco_0972315 [Tanacetum coccineum]
MKHSYSNDDTCFSIDVIDEILEEDFDALLDEGSEILYSIEGTIIKEKLLAEFDEFMAMNIEEDTESETKEIPFEKITFKTDYKIKTSLEEPPSDLELKPHLDHLEYVFLEEPTFLPVIISSHLSEQNKNKLIYESTQGTHRTTSAPRSPNPDVDEAGSSAPPKSTIIRLCIPPRRSERLTPTTPILTTAEADDIILQDIIQLRAENVENVEVDSATLRQDDTQTVLGTRLEPRSNKESSEVGITAAEQPVNVIKEEKEVSLPTMVDDRVKELTKTQVPVYVAWGLIMERQHSQVDVAKIIADAIQQERENLRAEINLQLQQDDLPICLALKYKFERLHVSNTPCRPSVIRLRDQDDPCDDAYPEGENSAMRQKTFEHRTCMFGESSSGQDLESEPDDDEIPTDKVSQELVDEMSHTVDEAKLRKVIDEMLRQRCASGDEHQYHIDQMQNFLKNDINLHAKIFYIKKQKEPRKQKEVVYLNLKIVQIIKTYWELGHEHKFITEIVARRENGSIVSITESDYKNLNKNDIEDMFMLIVNNKVDDYAETGLLWSLSVFIRSIEKYKVFSIISEPVYGIIYKNIKKEKRVMRHQEVHKFCDATLKRVLEGLKSYNNDVKHGYVTPSLRNKDAEYQQLFEEDIEERLKHRDQMRRWEMYVNGRPLGLRRERPE